MRWAFIGGAGLAGIGVAAAVASRRAERQALESFYGTQEPGAPVWEIREARVRPPAYFHHSDAFSALFQADLDAVSAALPARELVPVRLPGRRAGVLVSAYRHREVSIAEADGSTVTTRPYGEVLIAVPVTRRAAPPVLPLLAPGRFGTGAFVLHFPVTTRLIRDMGRPWGFPKFVADMDFADDPVASCVTLAEGGMRILTLTVRAAGRVTVDRAPTVLYSVLDGALLETVASGIAYQQTRFGGEGGGLDLGEHPVADDLRRLGLFHAPVLTRRELLTRIRMPSGRPVGAARPYSGYPGADAPLGRFTIRHAGGDPLDQYASPGTAELWTAPGTGREPGCAGAMPPVEDAEDLAALGLS